MSVRRNPQGPLRSAKLVRFEEVLFWDKTRPAIIKSRDDDRDYIVKQADRQDFLAHTHLGTSAAGHLIMDRNDVDEAPMRLWPNDFYPGRRISIPTRESLRDRGHL
jgi:hypothetical protein